MLRVGLLASGRGLVLGATLFGQVAIEDVGQGKRKFNSAKQLVFRKHALDLARSFRIVDDDRI